jgi:hypothetical protein
MPKLGGPKAVEARSHFNDEEMETQGAEIIGLRPHLVSDKSGVSPGFLVLHYPVPLPLPPTLKLHCWPPLWPMCDSV